MATAALKKIATEVEKVAKGVENASRKGKKPKQGEEDLDNKALTGLVINLKNALEQLVAYVGMESTWTIGKPVMRTSLCCGCTVSTIIRAGRTSTTA